ncbi:MAG: VWA domain-containing protein [Alistipes sp.]|nr:VWA domain-containing protein [Alistipes sp.]
MYQQHITHRNRTAIILLIDGSVSMKARMRINNSPIAMSDVAAMVANFVIDELVERARRNNRVRNYYDIAAIGYSGDGVVSLLPGDGDGLISVDRLVEYMPQPKTYVVEQKTPEGKSVYAHFLLHPWVEPKAKGCTPMYDALVAVKDIVEAWCNDPDNSDSFPPMVLHISNGDCSDAGEEELIEIARRITDTHTRDGNTLLVNLHLSPTNEANDFCNVFPSEATFHSKDPDRIALFKMSSVIPKSLEPAIYDMLHQRYRGPYRAVAFNTSVCEILSIINIGSASINDFRY